MIKGSENQTVPAMLQKLGLQESSLFRQDIGAGFSLFCISVRQGNTVVAKLTQWQLFFQSHPCLSQIFYAPTAPEVHTLLGSILP